MNILVCDDDKDIVEALDIYLSGEGFNVLRARDGAEALERLAQEEIDLVILDMMMPRLDGLGALRKMREERNIPVIMLSAKTEPEDKISGLSLGADDYVTKPFDLAELLARVNSHLRRYTQLGGAETMSDVYKTGGLIVDNSSKTVSVDGEEVRLTPVQYRILLFLTRNAGRVFSIDEIYSNVWNETPYNSDNTVAVHISNIREKIEINPREPKYLKVVWGVGYKIEKI